MGCVFCEIAAGSSPAVVVHRSDRAIALLPKGGLLAPGHCLVAPLAHSTDLFDVGHEDLDATMLLVQRGPTPGTTRSKRLRACRRSSATLPSSRSESALIHFGSARASASKDSGITASVPVFGDAQELVGARQIRAAPSASRDGRGTPTPGTTDCPAATATARSIGAPLGSASLGTVCRRFVSSGPGRQAQASGSRHDGRPRECPATGRGSTPAGSAQG